MTASPKMDDDGTKLTRETWMRRELTPFFGADSRPVRKGVYEVKTGPSWYVSYRFWNGKYWCNGGRSPREAISGLFERAFIQECPWRGLARKS